MASKTTSRTPETDRAMFCRAVEAAGLVWALPHTTHYQIRGGQLHTLVNCWPNTKRGFIKYRANDGSESHQGTVADAILLAGPPPAKASSPPWKEETVPQVGLIRWCWRLRLVQWLWRKVW